MILHTEEYLKELAPKRYKQLKAEGTLQETIWALDREMFDLFRDIKSRTVRYKQDNGTYPKGIPEVLKELTMIDQETEEIVRDMLADKIRGMA